MTNGSINAPFTDLKTALENPKLQDGHTIYLRQGVHKLTVDTTIRASGITVKPYPGEEASICFYTRDGWKRLFIEGDQVRFRHLRIWSDPPHRLIEGTQHRESNHLGAIVVNGDAPDDGLFADCRIHDLYSIAWWMPSRGGALYKDCDLLNIGTIDKNGRADGEALYTQNAEDAPTKTISNIIFGPSYANVTQIYAEQAQIAHYHLHDLVFCQSGTFYARGYLVGYHNVVIEQSAILGTGIYLGNGTDPSENTELVFQNNDIALIGSFRLGDQRNGQMSGNRVAMNRCDFLPGDFEGSVNRNSYYQSGPNWDFDTWQQATSFDSDSTYSPDPPAENWIRINPCSTPDANRIAHIAIFNWQQLDTVSADVSALDLQTGATYRLRNALDPLNDVETLAYDGSGAISIGMAERSVATPIGADAPLKAWDKRYGAFILEAI